jgi:hypothetical protein
MLVLVDESGDLGWVLERPYRQGGSSKYLTLALMFLPKVKKHLPKNLILSQYTANPSWRPEKKGQSATLHQKINFCQEAIKILASNKDIKIDVITVKKENVRDAIRQDPNKLYNYMCGLIIPDHVGAFSNFEFMPDERTVKVKSGNSLVDYLQTELFFKHNLNTKIVNKPQLSQNCYNLQFVDWIVNCIWINYEDGINGPFKILSPHIKIRQLYFNP